MNKYEERNRKKKERKIPWVRNNDTGKDEGKKIEEEYFAFLFQYRNLLNIRNIWLENTNNHALGRAKAESLSSPDDEENKTAKS